VLQDRNDPDRFKCHVDEGATFQVDRRLLMQILENLIGNAEKYASPGEIFIFIRSGRNRVTTDQGPPGTVSPLSMLHFEISNRVSPENAPDANRLFDRYYRHSSVVGLPGIGIGLNLVEVAADNLGAKVHYRFENGWAIFEVIFPS
jgi:signal transduction histidine kinase